MISLVELGSKYPTSKGKHGFLEIYENYFEKLRNNELNILEIGVENGDSLRIWSSFFVNSKICGIDIVKKNFIIKNCEIFCGSQSDSNFLLEIINKYKYFDIIIDDGSHQSKDIIFSFNYLFDHLKDGGLYVIEDLQTSYQPRYGGSRFKLNKTNTSMNFVKSLADSINYETDDKPFFKKKKFDGKVKSISIHQNIAFIKKGVSKNYFYGNLKKNTLSDKLKKIISFFYK